MKPRARRSDLLEEPVADELILYDQTTHRAHRLNPAAATLWRLCDGDRDLGRLVRELSRQVGTPADDPTAALAGLEELQAAGLLERGLDPRQARQFDRRAALKVAAALLPVVTSIVAPVPARAQTFRLPPPAPPPPPEPEPEDLFELFNGDYAGRATLVEYTYPGFSMRSEAAVGASVDSEGNGELAVDTEQKERADPPKRRYQVTVRRGGRFEGGGSFTDQDGGTATCTIEGRFRSDGNRVRFTETITFSNGMIGTAVWEIRADK